MKKFLAALLAVLMLFSASCITVFAEEATEPEVTTKEYEISEDADFTNVVYLEAGNDAATILKPGDTIFTYKSTELKIDYYPDADARAKGKWVPSDKNNLAFSLTPTTTDFKRDSFKKVSGQSVAVATIKDIDFTDFTIAYSDENTFVGWVIYEYNPTSNVISLCAVWDKQHKVEVDEDNVSDYEYIVNTRINIWKAIFKPFTFIINFISNGILYIGNFFHELFYGNSAAA